MRQNDSTVFSQIQEYFNSLNKLQRSPSNYLLVWLQIDGRVANSVDPAQTPHDAASELGSHCLLRPVCPKTQAMHSTSCVTVYCESLDSLEYT